MELQDRCRIDDECEAKPKLKVMLLSGRMGKKFDAEWKILRCRMEELAEEWKNLQNGRTSCRMEELE